jgi:hypothetical protein
MNEPSWLENVRESLARKALPPSYVRRILEELADHVEDLQEDAMGGELDIPGRLGKPEDVAAAASASYRPRGLLRSHSVAPGVVFGLSPLLLLPVAFVAAWTFTAWVLARVVERTEWIDERLDSLRHGGAGVEFFLSCFMSVVTIAIPIVLVSAFYRWLARRSGVASAWGNACAVVLAVVASAPAWVATLSPIPGESRLSVAVLSVEGWLPLRLIQFALPFIVFCLLPWDARTTPESKSST